MGAQNQSRSGVTHCWRAINTCSSFQTGMSPALTPSNEVSFVLQQWEMEAGWQNHPWKHRDLVAAAWL